MCLNFLEDVFCRVSSLVDSPALKKAAVEEEKRSEEEQQEARRRNATAKEEGVFTEETTTHDAEYQLRRRLFVVTPTSR